MRKFFYLLGYALAGLVAYTMLSAVCVGTVYLFYLLLDWMKESSVAQGFLFALFGIGFLLHTVFFIKQGKKKYEEKERTDSLLQGLKQGKIVVMSEGKK